MRRISNLLVTILFLAMILSTANARSYIADADNYTTFFNKLEPGDTLFLTKGTYTKTMRLIGIHGTIEKPIVITGENDNTSVFEGQSGRNTISLTKCSYLTIQNLKIDGKGLPVDAVKAEGTDGNFAHHIILQNLHIINHHSNMQIVGINTKCPAWDWIIRNNIIDYAGTGIYLGNSDGTKPFVNSIIEYNLIMHTIGYNMEIKHQNENLRNLPGMPKNGKTIIRYNVFSREPDKKIKQSKRPNLLVGNFPAKGDGSDDVYEIYGNFFWQNPVEALFQGTGNIALYANIFVNYYESKGYRAVYITKHNKFKPRNIAVFHNTLYVRNTSGGIRLYSADKNYNQYAWTNAVFSALPVTNFPDSFENIADSYDNAALYLLNISQDIKQLDLYPQTGKLFAEAVDMSLFNKFTDYNLDFNGNKYNEAFRGAYSGSGRNLGWKPALEIRPPVGNPTDIEDFAGKDNKLCISPNPATDYVDIAISGDRTLTDAVQVHDVLGNVVLTLTPTLSLNDGGVKLDVSGLLAGVYFVRVGGKMYKFVKL